MSISTTIKTIQDIMRKDVGVDGDAQRIGQLVWMIQGKKKLRLALKGMSLASSEKALKEEAIVNLVHVLHERPVYIIIPKSKILALLNFHECETAKPI